MIRIFLAIFFQYNLMFAKASSSSQPANQKIVFASELNVTMLGSIVVSKNQNNVILLKDRETGAVQAMRVGFLLFKKYTITDIQANSIVLSYDENGKTNYLTVYRDGFAIPIAKQPQVAESVPAPLNDDSYSEEGFQRDKSEIRMTEAYRDRLIKEDLAKILMQASAEPVVAEGRIIGFLLDQIEGQSIYEKAGIKNGDIVTSINGIPLDDVTATIKLLHSLKKSEEVGFEIKRNGQLMPVSIKVQ